jgi:hypothetical protein
VESWVFSGRFEECGELYKGKCPFVWYFLKVKGLLSLDMQEESSEYTERQIRMWIFSLKNFSISWDELHDKRKQKDFLTFSNTFLHSAARKFYASVTHFFIYLSTLWHLITRPFLFISVHSCVDEYQRSIESYEQLKQFASTKCWIM